MVDQGSKPVDVAAAAAGELSEIDSSPIETLTRLKTDCDRLDALIAKAEAQREDVPATVFERVVGDYRARIADLETEARPLRGQARKELLRVQEIHRRLRGALEAAMLDRQEIEFRHSIGEIAEESFAGQHSTAEEVVTTCQARFDEAEALRQRFADLVPDEPEDAAPPAQAPAQTPAQPPPPPTVFEPMVAPAGLGEPGYDPQDDPAATTARELPPAAEAEEEDVGSTSDSARLRTMAVPVGRLSAADNPEQSFILGATATIGRTPDNDIQVNAGSVSRRHARIFATADGYMIKDLGSGNGTLVNDERVGEAILKDGDRLCFGTEQYVFRVAD